MKIKAIIAHRNELPKNLHRTFYHIKSHGIDVDLVSDAPAMGCGYRRHEGIMSCKADAVLICDAHMAFSPGYFDGVIQHLKSNPKDITVSSMQSMDHDMRPIEGHVYYGGRPKIKDRWDQNYIPFAIKWRNKNTGYEPIGGVMGACYGMTVENYRNMGQPLSILRAWGCDEELLSAAAWMTGGRCHMIPGVAYHMFAAPRSNPENLSDAEAVEIWANRLAVINAIPMPAGLKRELTSHLANSRFVWERKALINQAMEHRVKEIERLHEALSQSSIDFVTYINAWQEPDDVAFEIRRMEMVKHADKQRREKRVYTQAPRVIDEGVPCPHCTHRYDHHVTNTYANGNRRRLCGKCKKPFISARK